MEAQLTQAEIQLWTSNLKTANKTLTISTLKGEIVKVSDAAGNILFDLTGWLQDQITNNWEDVRKYLSDEPIAKYIARVVKSIAENSWKGLDGFQVPVSAIGGILNSFVYAEDGLASIFKIVIASFHGAAKLAGAEDMASYTKYINDASKTMFKNRTFDDDDIRNIVKTWSSNHPKESITIHTTKTYLGFSVNEMETVSLAQIIVAMFFSLFEGLLVIALAQGLVSAYKKITGNAKDAYKVGLAKIMRSRVAAFYRIKLTYLKYVNLVDQGETNMDEIYGQNNLQIFNRNQKIHDKIDALAKKDIPKVWFDATLWYTLCNNEWYNCVLEQSLYKHRLKVQTLDNHDPESLGNLYIGMQKQIYKMLASVVDQLSDKQVQDAKTKQQKTVQTDKKDVQ